MSADSASALTDRARLIEGRALALVAETVRIQPPWLRRLGQPPIDPALRSCWLREIAAIVAFRDRYQIEGDHAFGSSVSSLANTDAVRARACGRAVSTLAEKGASEPGLGRATTIAR